MPNEILPEEPDSDDDYHIARIATAGAFTLTLVLMLLIGQLTENEPSTPLVIGIALIIAILLGVEGLSRVFGR